VGERARIVLQAAEGLENKQIARRMSITPEKAVCRRMRSFRAGVAVLEEDAPRPGRMRSIADQRTKKTVDMAQAQTLDCTQPGLLMKRGHSDTMTHDYQHNHTATSFTDLNAQRTGIPRCSTSTNARITPSPSF
jgi:hypothetical protein